MYFSMIFIVFTTPVEPAFAACTILYMAAPHVITKTPVQIALIVGAGRFDHSNSSLLFLPGLSFNQGYHGFRMPKPQQMPLMAKTPNQENPLKTMVSVLVMIFPRTTLNHTRVVTHVVDVDIGVSPTCVSQLPMSIGVCALSPLKKKGPVRHRNARMPQHTTPSQKKIKLFQEVILPSRYSPTIAAILIKRSNM